MEIWKKIKGFENYQISNFGNVKSFHFGHEILRKTKINKDGYVSVILTIKRKQKNCLIHRLVAEASKKNDLSVSLISMICNGKRKGNFKFKIK